MLIQPSTLHLTIEQAAHLAGCSKSAVQRALNQGRLTAVYTAQGRALVLRESLDLWIEWRFFYAGGTDDADKISVNQAAELVEMRPANLVDYIERGAFTEHRNPAGRYILDRQEFEAWRHTIAPPRSRLDPSLRWYTVEEIRKLTGYASHLPIYSEIQAGRLKATQCRDPHTIHVVAQADLQKWLKERSRRFPQVALKGEKLTLEEAARRYGVTVMVLRQGMKLGMIPASRQVTKGPVIYLVGSEDVEEYLKLRASDEAWTLVRAAEFLGLKYPYLVRVTREGDLPSRLDRHPAIGPRRIVDPDQLMEWFARQRIPYRKEAVHLSNVADLSEAARCSHRILSDVRICLEDGTLPNWKGLIPRFALDRWLEQQGLPPSWQADRDSQWLRTDAAAREAGVSKYLVHKWINSDEVQSRARGRNYLVHRQSLLRRAEEYFSQPPLAPELKTPYQTEAPVARLTQDYYTIVEAARLSGMTPGGAYKALERGKYGYERGSGQRLYPRQEIQRWLESRKI
ncbi:helix-turn-helix domain-containing protein [bacterium]|nr:helix-turn-helix domain-containing protein [bacterium]